ncbi:hypothetical protein AB0L97_19370 [Nocardia sp. NPDC051911]|uniref:hypothetical protein n=1 Tax=Nocardia sp. NPDC051911 TaxID=3154648 RepID=UPI00342F95D4
MTDYTLRPIGHVESVLTDPATAPRQPDEGAPPAWLVIDDHVPPPSTDSPPAWTSWY